MATLHIDFQEGWTGDQVLVTIDGVDRRTLDTVTTRTQIGLAAQIEEDVPAGRRTITITVSGRQLAGSHDVEIDDEHWVAVSIEAGRLVFNDQPELYGYA